MFQYTYRVTWSEEDREYVGLCVEFPSLSWLDKKQELALHGIRRTVADAVADLRATGEPVSQPLSLHRYTGRFVVRVPPATHRRIAIEAAEARVSMNRLVSEKLALAP